MRFTQTQCKVLKRLREGDRIEARELPSARTWQSLEKIDMTYRDTYGVLHLTDQGELVARLVLVRPSGGEYDVHWTSYMKSVEAIVWRTLPQLGRTFGKVLHAFSKNPETFSAVDTARSLCNKADIITTELDIERINVIERANPCPKCSEVYGHILNLNKASQARPLTSCDFLGEREMRNSGRV